jgi:hypothetical protein
MSSQIDETNIDSTYPVAGKDNDSQGFRDNFSAIKTNFTYTKSEIEDLQSKVVLKAALTGGTLANDLGGSNIYNGSFTNFHGTSYAQTVSGSANINIENGSLQSFTLTADSVFTFTNWPASGNYAKVRAHFKSNGSAVSVGNDVTIGQRYTINEVETTNFVLMGADPTAVFVGSINGNTLTVSSKTAGTIGLNTFITGTNVAAGTKIIATQTENPLLSGTGGQGTYTVNIGSQSVSSTNMNGMTVGVVFTATNKGSGTGTVKPWKSVTLNTEGSGTITPSSDFSLPLLLNPNGSDQVIEAWTWTGDTSKKIYVNYISNLDDSQTNYSNLQVGTLSVSEGANSTSVDSGSLQVKGGAGIAKNLNVGGNTIISGNLTVTGNTTLTTSSITINDINSITNVDINSPRTGDALKYNANTSTWTNNVDLVTYQVTVADNGSGTQPVFFIDNVALSTNLGTQASNLKALRPGKKYRFSQIDSSNFGYDLRFSTKPDTVSNPDNEPGERTTLDYSNNVTVVGIAGSAGAYTEILVTEDTPSPLYLYGKQADRPLVAAFNLSNLVILGTQGQIQVSSCTLTTNQPIRISGTWAASSGSPSLAGYQSAGTTYYVKTGGTGTTFQLLFTPNGDPVQSTAGTPNGTQLTISALHSVASYTETSKVGGEYPVTVGGGPVKVIKDYTVPGSQSIIADTTNNAITITLPLAPSVGTTISIFDGGHASTNAITIDPGDAAITVNGKTGDVVISGNYGALTLVCDGINWTMAKLSFNGSEDVASSASVSLNTSVSYFVTSGVESCSLADGTEGQTKTLVMKSASGTMSVSVASAGWKTSGSGTIVFNTTGDCCILQFVQGKWYVIGNNSCVVEGVQPAEVVSAPGTASSTGLAGQIAYDSSYVYVCVAANTWKRAAIASW